MSPRANRWIGLAAVVLLALTAAGQTAGAARQQTRPAVEALVAKAVAYVDAYERELSGIVAEEEYVQRWFPLRAAPELRRLRSDFLMVKLRPSDPWVPFRDVYEVNGVAVRDRDDRLQKLFLDAPATAEADARRIKDESARYNIGRIERNINVPTLALEFLRGDGWRRFRFRAAGEDDVDGTATVRLEFTEERRPTIIRTSRGRDVPAFGSFWIDPRDGAIRRTFLRVTPEFVATEITVTYCPCEWGALVPCRMTEYYRIQADELRATATYSNFRRFQVIVSKPEIK
jgi:hypothetical protein